MANFQGHITGAAIGSGVLSSGLLSLGLLSTPEASVAFLIGTMGGLSPDLDSDNSTPFVIGTKLFSIFLAFAVMFSKASDYSLIEMAIIWLVIYFFLKFVVFTTLKKFTKHRGMFHSVPAGMVGGMLIVYSSFYLFEVIGVIAWLYGFFFFFGYLIHLLMDEFVSLNLMGKSMKRSFGTAFKFYNKRDKIGSISVYVSLILLIYFAPSFSEFANIFGDVEVLKSFAYIILPEGVWFENFFNF